MNRIDYLKKYNVFNIVLFLWIMFLPMKNAIYQGSVILMVLIFIFHVSYFKNIKNVKEIVKCNLDIFIGFALVVCAMIISSIIGGNISESFSSSVKYFYRYILIFLVLLYFYKQKFFTRKFLFITIIISLGIYAFDGFFQYINGENLFGGHKLHGNGINGATFNRNVFGFIMAIQSCVLTYVLFENKIKKLNLNLATWSLFFITIFVLFNSLSRASWLFFIAFFVLYFVYKIFSKKVSFKSYIYFFIIILSITFFFQSNDVLLSRLQSLLDGDSSSRFLIWGKSLIVIKDNMLFGNGIYDFTDIVGLKFASSHNIFIDILIYLGGFGLVAFFYLYFKIFKYVKISKNYIYGFFMVGFLVYLQFDGSFLRSKLHASVFIILLFLIYSYRLNKNEIDNDSTIKIKDNK